MGGKGHGGMGQQGAGNVDVGVLCTRDRTHTPRHAGCVHTQDGACAHRGVSPKHDQRSR